MVRLGVADGCAVCPGTPHLGIEEHRAAGGVGPVLLGDCAVLPHVMERWKHLSGAGRRAAGKWSVLGAFSGATARIYVPAAGLQPVAGGEGPAAARSRRLAAGSRYGC